ncbi:MAG: aromatic ring-hydroxylating dioxygenase subunit alpha [Proteobacteria bacterium]|nr:aromatic ring-hydroxylating dioxygenase subunit alpha [Pseudomonadota bacterium]
MFLRNYWYAAGFSEEVGRDFLARTYLNENVVLFRREDGTPVALEDRCAHRRLPLSLGKLIGDTVECGYHGLLYDCAGTCIKIPGQDRVPKGTGVKSYPIVERHRYLWIWMGDPKLADESTIPDFSRIDDPAYEVSNIKFRHDAHVQLIIDNLMDLSHLAYVHSTTTGSPQIAELAQVETVRKDNTISVKRWMEDVPAPRTHREFGGYNGNMDSWQVSEFSPPTYVRVSYGSRGTGSGVPGSDWFEDQGHWGFYVFHGLTPETEMTAHQFRYIAFDKGIGNKKETKEFIRQCDQIITEDAVVFPIQQRAINDDVVDTNAWNINERVRLVHDGGLLQSRQIVEDLLAKQATKDNKATRKKPRKRPAAR